MIRVNKCTQSCEILDKCFHQVGAGHGGQGGRGSDTEDAKGLVNDNLFEPELCGSGGHETQGGGVLKVTGATLTLDGYITAKYVCEKNMYIACS